MANYRIWSLLFIVGTITCASPLNGNVPVRAADATPPLILIINGDLWAWAGPDKPLKQLSNWGYNRTPVISPDGRHVAYLSTAAIRVEQYRKGNIAFADNGPQNIWVIDLATGDGTRVADQPPGATDAGYPQGWSVDRRQPAWSPDGKMLAWTDLTCCVQPAPDGSTGPWEELVVYDWQNKSSRIVARQLPIGRHNGLRNPSTLDWGLAGLLFLITPEPDAVYLYSPEGKQLSRVDLSLEECVVCWNVHWIKNGSKALILVERPPDVTSPYLLIDPATGQEVTDVSKSTRAERYSLSAPDGITLYRDGKNWFAAESGKAPLDLGEGSPEPDWISIAPGGKQAAFVKDSKAFLVSGGKISEIPVGEGKSVAGVAWSMMGWRLGQS